VIAMVIGHRVALDWAGQAHARALRRHRQDGVALDGARVPASPRGRSAGSNGGAAPRAAAAGGAGGCTARLETLIGRASPEQGDTHDDARPTKTSSNPHGGPRRERVIAT